MPMEPRATRKQWGLVRGVRGGAEGSLGVSARSGPSLPKSRPTRRCGCQNESGEALCRASPHRKGLIQQGTACGKRGERQHPRLAQSAGSGAPNQRHCPVASVPAQAASAPAQFCSCQQAIRWGRRCACRQSADPAQACSWTRQAVSSRKEGLVQSTTVLKVARCRHLLSR